MNAAPKEFWMELNGVDTIEEAFDEDTIDCTLVNADDWLVLISAFDWPLLFIGRRSAWTAENR
jgi:hypothetical protein